MNTYLTDCVKSNLENIDEDTDGPMAKSSDVLIKPWVKPHGTDGATTPGECTCSGQDLRGDHDYPKLAAMPEVSYFALGNTAKVFALLLKFVTIALNKAQEKAWGDGPWKDAYSSTNADFMAR